MLNLSEKNVNFVAVVLFNKKDIQRLYFGCCVDSQIRVQCGHMQKKPLTTSKRLIQNTIINVFTHIATAVIAFCLIGFFMGQLGQQRYGLWVLIASIFRYRMLLNMGLNSAINRYVPVCLAHRDDNGVVRVVSTSFFFLLATGVVLALLSLKHRHHQS